MRFAALGIVMVVVLNLCAVPPAQARKADTLWTKVNCGLRAISPDDKMVVGYYAAELDPSRSFRFMDIRTGAELWSIPLVSTRTPSFVYLTPDSQSAILYRTKGFERYDFGEHTSTRFESDGDTIDGISGERRRFDLSYDGSTFVSTKSTADGKRESDTLIFWDVKTGRITKRLSIPDIGEMGYVYLSSDTKRAFVFAYGCQGLKEFRWYVVDLETAVISTLPFAAPRTNLTFSPDRTRIAVEGWLGGIHIYDGTDYREVALLTYKSGSGVLRAEVGAFTKNNDIYATVRCSDGSTTEGFVEIWDVTSRKCIDTIYAVPGYKDCPSLLCITSDARYLGCDLLGYTTLTDRKIDTTTSEVISSDNAHTLYPNPTTHTVQVRTALSGRAGLELGLSDMNGNASFDISSSLLTRDNNELVFDVSRFPSGTYLLRIMAPGATAESMKIIINR